MLSAVVLTKNEERNIERCLGGLDFCNEIIIVDDYSNDRTLEKIQKALKSKVYKVFHRELKGDFADQRNFGLSKTGADWVLFIDADEIVTSNLKDEIISTVRQTDREGFYIRRRDFFWGKELKFGEIRMARNKGILRLVKKNSGKWMGNVHEVFHTVENTGKLKNFLNHYPHPTIKEFISDINNYSTLRAQELYNQGKNTNILEIMFTPALKFIYTFLFNLGFLDGAAGFTYAFMMSFHSYLVRAKLYQHQHKS